MLTCHLCLIVDDLHWAPYSYPHFLSEGLVMIVFCTTSSNSDVVHLAGIALGGGTSDDEMTSIYLKPGDSGHSCGQLIFEPEVLSTP